MLHIHFCVNCIHSISIVPHSAREEATIETYDRKSVDKLAEAVKFDEQAGNVQAVCMHKNSSMDVCTTMEAKFCVSSIVHVATFMFFSVRFCYTL